MSRTPRTKSARSVATELVELIHVTERELAEAKAERDALTAQVHVLREALEQIAAGLSPNSQRPHVETARAALALTPATALKGWVRREVLEQCVDVLKENSRHWERRECHCDPKRYGTECCKHRSIRINNAAVAAARKELGE